VGVITGAGVGVGVGDGLGVGGGFSITNKGDGVGRTAAIVYRGAAKTAMVPATRTRTVRTKRMRVRMADWEARVADFSVSRAIYTTVSIGDHRSRRDPLDAAIENVYS
jgi:hypothetical protein